MQSKSRKLAEVYEQLHIYLMQQGMVEPIVCGDGCPEATILMLGEAPGSEEVRQGKPFVGKAGKNLDAFLQQTGINREQIFISNVVKFRPYRVSARGRKANRPPNRMEIEWCRPFLLKELAIISPNLIVTLGNTALQALLGNQALIGQYHGCLVEDAQRRKIFPLYHPASVIYNSQLKEIYAKDLEALRNYIAVK